MNDIAGNVAEDTEEEGMAEDLQEEEEEEDLQEEDMVNKETVFEKAAENHTKKALQRFLPRILNPKGESKSSFHFLNFVLPV